ncbi:MAG: hypothetical protein H7832_01700 [Magnetococcus sp. DMHC-6]
MLKKMDTTTLNPGRLFFDLKKKGVWGIAPRVLPLLLTSVLLPSKSRGIGGMQSPKVLTLLFVQALSLIVHS